MSMDEAVLKIIDVEAIAKVATEEVMEAFSFSTLEGPENLRARLNIATRSAAYNAGKAAIAACEATLRAEDRWQDIEDAEKLLAYLAQAGEDEACPVVQGLIDHVRAVRTTGGEMLRAFAEGVEWSAEQKAAYTAFATAIRKHPVS